ncbi:hypothetical protein [Cupriavidus basilensis]|uniref:Uncharacterized protein n=1 Tax=Cupriavidus basilensis TaxID=68895 RepID=A0A643FSH8_9BURK|nr:hypothetical protein [Cupriavidus basilensis]QOT82197.1 hypothetical protein F7R26_039490 [Cupriavidus basilensis]
MGNSKHSAGCQFPARDGAEPFPFPTVGQAAQRLLDALDELAEGSGGFSGWENAAGRAAGDAVEEARHELRTLLERPRALPEPAIFEKVFRSPPVQRAAESMGWRGLAEAIWRAAYEGE